MISSNDFRTGVTIVLDGSVWRVIEFLHVKPGKGSAFVRTKLKNSQTGSVVERTFRAGETVPQATLEKSEMQHTYKDGEDFVFMDMETYEEARLKESEIGDRVKYLKDGMTVNVVRWGEQVSGSRTPELRHLSSGGNRSRSQRRYRHGGYKTRYCGNRCSSDGSPIYY